MPSRRPRHSTLVAYLALFAALSGVSFAVGHSTASSSKSERIAKPSMRDTTTKPGRIARAGRLATTAARRGPRGPRGRPGPRGPRGLPGATNAVTRIAGISSTPVYANLSGGQVGCAPGETATGGGFFSGETAGVVNSFPVLTGTRPTGWEVHFASFNQARRIFVVCVQP